MSKRRIAFVESLLSLGSFAHQGYIWLVGPAVAVGGPLFLAWGAVSAAAATYGWWVYPLVIALCLFATFGLWMFVLFLNSRVRLMSAADVRIDEEQQAVRRLSDELLGLAAELNEMIGEYQSRPPTLYADHSDTDAWQRENWNIASRLTQKFMTKCATKAHALLLRATRYGVVSKREVEWKFATLHSYSIAEIRSLLVRAAVELQNQLQIPVEQALPHIPAFDAQRRLPLERGD